MFKIDLHTHSIDSMDGGLSAEQYRHAFRSGVIDCVAVTDHNEIEFAEKLYKQLGPRIIVGEEIMTAAGEIIGLFLKKLVNAGLSPLETVKLIKDQGGLVYIPHPFETIRKGLQKNHLDELTNYIDIVEVKNGRALFQNRGQKASDWARDKNKPGAASSDAHGWRGLGTTYTSVSDIPVRKNLVNLLANATFMSSRPRPRALLYPKYNRLRKKLVSTK